MTLAAAATSPSGRPRSRASDVHRAHRDDPKRHLRADQHLGGARDRAVAAGDRHGRGALGQRQTHALFQIARVRRDENRPKTGRLECLPDGLVGGRVAKQDAGCGVDDDRDNSPAGFCRRGYFGRRLDAGGHAHVDIDIIDDVSGPGGGIERTEPGKTDQIAAKDIGRVMQPDIHARQADQGDQNTGGAPYRRAAPWRRQAPCRDDRNDAIEAERRQGMAAREAERGGVSAEKHRWAGSREGQLQSVFEHDLADHGYPDGVCFTTPARQPKAHDTAHRRHGQERRGAEKGDGEGEGCQLRGSNRMNGRAQHGVGVDDGLARERGGEDQEQCEAGGRQNPDTPIPGQPHAALVADPPTALNR